MKPILQIRFPTTGHVYQLPTKVVVDHQAANGVKQIPPEAYALFHMTWPELEPHARLVEFEQPARDMTTALTMLVDRETAMAAPATGEAVLSAPIEAMLSAAASAGQMFSSYIIAASDGTPVVHIAITTSAPEAVKLANDSYAYLRDSVTEHLRDAAATTNLN